MKEPQWSDVGMWLQTIMLLLRGEGLDTCAQEYMGTYGRTIKAHLGLSDDTLLFCRARHRLARSRCCGQQF
jgi:hypothetical protein